jgi:hypothetical protein
LEINDDADTTVECTNTEFVKGGTFEVCM